MIVRVIVPRALSEFAGGQTELRVELPHEPTVGQLVRALEESYPALARRIVDETGALRRFVNVYVGTEECRRIGALTAAIPEGTDVHIIGSIAGGASDGLMP